MARPEAATCRRPALVTAGMYARVLHTAYLGVAPPHTTVSPHAQRQLDITNLSRSPERTLAFSPELSRTPLTYVPLLLPRSVSQSTPFDPTVNAV
jgi:hypothetical protein